MDDMEDLERLCAAVLIDSVPEGLRMVIAIMLAKAPTAEARASAKAEILERAARQGAGPLLLLAIEACCDEASISDDSPPKGA